MKRLVLLFISIFCVAFAANAQLKYENGNLRYNVPDDFISKANNTAVVRQSNPNEYIIWKARTNLFVGNQDGAEFYLLPGSAGTRMGPIERGYIDMCDKQADYHDVYLRDIYQVSGHGTITITPASMSTNSATNTLMRLNPVTYRTPEQNASQYSRRMAAANGTEMGFIAQEVAEVLPNAVRITENDQYLVNQISMIPLMVKAIQEQNARIEAQNAQIEALKTEIETLKNR